MNKDKIAELQKISNIAREQFLPLINTASFQSFLQAQQQIASLVNFSGIQKIEQMHQQLDSISMRATIQLAENMQKTLDAFGVNSFLNTLRSIQNQFSAIEKLKSSIVVHNYFDCTFVEKYQPVFDSLKQISSAFEKFNFFNKNEISSIQKVYEDFVYINEQEENNDDVNSNLKNSELNFESLNSAVEDATKILNNIHIKSLDAITTVLKRIEKLPKQYIEKFKKIYDNSNFSTVEEDIVKLIDKTDEEIISFLDEKEISLQENNSKQSNLLAENAQNNNNVDIQNANININININISPCSILQKIEFAFAMISFVFEAINFYVTIISPNIQQETSIQKESIEQSNNSTQSIEDLIMHPQKI